MAVNNKITAKAPATAQESAIVFRAGDEEIKLTKAMVKNYLVSGDSARVTDQELTMFMMMCKANKLNPWIREAYCIKYGDNPATMVVGKEAFIKRAEASPEYDGMTSGIIVYDPEAGSLEYRQGILRVGNEQIIGGWAEVFRKDRQHSTRIEVSMEEYAGRKKDGSLNGQWSAKPGTMIRKVAQVQALREAFPTAVGGMYTAEEQGHEEEPVTMAPIDAEVTEVKEAPKAQPKPAKEPEPVEESDSLL